MRSDTSTGPLSRLASAPFHPILFAAFPILFLFSQNLGQVSLLEAVPPLAIAVGAATVAFVALSLILRDARRAAIVVTTGAIASLAYGHAQRLATDVHLGGVPLAILWAGATFGALVFAFRARARLAPVSRVLNYVSAVLVVIQLVAIVPFEVKALTTAQVTEGPTGLTAANGHTTRDIYYIILDRYGSARSLGLDYGITDDPFYDWLSSHGFIVAKDSHANYVRTSLSLAATLNMSFLDDVAKQQGPDSVDLAPINALLSNHAVGRFLKGEGYKYIHIGSYFSPTQQSTIADVNKHLGGAGDFGAAVYDESILPTVARRLGLLRSAPANQRHADNALYEFNVLDDYISEPGPKFVFAHILLPHPPYVFASDGRVLSEDQEKAISAREQFRQQLLFTNDKMESFLGPLIAKPEAERPIIIIQADEGPYPPPYARDTVHYDWATATPDQLEIKYGILNAMLLPGVDPAVVYPTISSVNTFRMLFDQYFGANLPLLPDRSFTSAGKFLPYDFTDITARLPTLH